MPPYLAGLLTGLGILIALGVIGRLMAEKVLRRETANRRLVPCQACGHRPGDPVGR